MKTKPLLLATAGSTVDGRTIDEKMLKEMASSYDPKTYGARLNIEHIRGISGEKPFRAYGDVLEVSTGEVDVNFNGKNEKRLGLFGVFDVTDDAKALNNASQKVYPSIEIEENFGGKGFAYLMGCALTDSPASIATERLKFNRQLPGTIHLARDEAVLFEFAEDKTGEGGGALLGSLKSMLDSFAAKFAKEEPKPDDKPADPKPAAFTAADFAPLLEGFTKVATSIDAMRGEFREEIDSLAVKFKRLEDERESTPANHYTPRPRAAGANGQYAKTDC